MLKNVKPSRLKKIITVPLPFKSDNSIKRQMQNLVSKLNVPFRARRLVRSSPRNKFECDLWDRLYWVHKYLAIRRQIEEHGLPRSVLEDKPPLLSVFGVFH